MKTKINAIINILEILLFIPTALTSLIFFIVWPQGSGSYQGGHNINYVSEFWGIEKQQWSNLHTYIGLAFILLMLIHILLDLKWFKALPKILFNLKTKNNNNNN